MTDAVRTNWEGRLKHHNGPLDATFVYGTNRVIYNMTARYSGAPGGTSTYNGPTNKLCGYALDFPGDDRIFGSTSMVLDTPSSDGFGQRERVAYWMAEQLELFVNNRRYVHFYVNGRYMQDRSSGGAKVYEDTTQPGSDYLEQWYPDGNDGILHKLDLLEEWKNAPVSQDADLQALVFPTLQYYLTTNSTTGLQEKKKTRYRWGWEKRAEQTINDDFTELFKLVDRVNTNDSTYTTNVEALVEIEEWMRVFALEVTGIPIWIARAWDTSAARTCMRTSRQAICGGCCCGILMAASN
jgi:hypothetical protein